jgi:hypothetical protein
MIDRFRFEDINNCGHCAWRQAGRAEPVVLGLTKAALNTESFLAAGLLPGDDTRAHRSRHSRQKR